MTPSDQDQTQFTLRLDGDLHSAARAAADDADLSLNRLVDRALREHLARAAAPDRLELEQLDGDGNPPGFRLVAPFTAATPWVGHGVAVARYGVEVDGVPRPELTVYHLNEDGVGGYQLQLDGRFAMTVGTYEELWKLGWFVAMAVDNVFTGTDRPAWVDPGGAPAPLPMSSFLFEVTFELPSHPADDDYARSIRENLVKRVAELGGRHPYTRLLRTSPMIEEGEVARMTEAVSGISED